MVRAGTPSTRSAFTLLETIVSVGAVAIIAVGLAAIFSAVGKTVAGGQRLSTLNQYSALLEERLREDMDRMSRDGFLVIRQQWADPNNNGQFEPAIDRIPLSAEDTGARPRRIDELMFFAEGRFQTSRPAMHPGVVAEADAARIYYGHGQPRRLPTTAGNEDNEPYFRPLLSDRNNDPLALLGAPDLSNPNRFAGNWTLIRHQTLLVEPSVAPQPPISGLVFGFDPNTAGGRLVLSNKDGQIALQPAAGSLFRSLARRFPDDTLISANAFLHPDFVRPAFNSGIVDIACSDLSELRTFVMLYPEAPSTLTSTTDVAGAFLAGRTFALSTFVATRPLPAAAQSIDLMHAWMDDAMPTQSAPAGSDLTDYRGAPNVDPAGTRLRTEVAGPDLLRVVSGAATNDAREQAFRRADQLALASSGLLPRCSEFIVEWSFGNTFANGQTIWHGLERREDSDGNGIINAADAIAASPFTPDTTANDPRRVRTRISGTTFHDLTERVIYGYTPTATQSSLTSYFGYIDPTYAPADESQPKALSCPWPRMIRITVTLSDAVDPTIESTFQFVFRTPQNPGTPQN
jgi:type II secretory pathway pseudopilin PulG